MEPRKNLKWAAVFLLIIAASIAVWFLHRSFAKPPKTAQILQNGVVIRTVDLENVAEPYEFELVSENGGHNTIRVENGRIGVVAADCPDKICVRQGFIESGVLPIVCLPHRLSVVITDEGGVDAAAGGMR